MTRLPPNPWTDLPTRGAKVAVADRPYVEAFNATLADRKGGDRFALHTELMPEPFMGDPARAQVLLLQLNPGFVADDVDAHADWRFRQRARANLVHSAEYPVFLLDPALDRVPGWQWWHRATGPLRRAVTDRIGDPEEALRCLAAGLMVVEFHGYHSSGYRQLPVTLPSQTYGFALVERAIERGTPILIGRGEAIWKVAVPALGRPRAAVTLTNRQRTSISPANLDGDGKGDRRFAGIVDRICHGGR